jgi:uncharacterized protein YecT (DUF1311 family)
MHKRTPFVIAVLLLCCGGVAALALSTRSPATADPGSCLDAQTTLAMITCRTTAYDDADRQLNAAYKRLRFILGRSDRVQLASAEEAWVRFKTADCTSWANRYRGGSFAAVARLDCLILQTRRRLADLRIIVRLRPSP